MDYIVLDIETTGLDNKKNEITEIGAVKIIDGKITDTFETLVYVEGDIPIEITVLTGISNKMLEDKPGIDTVLKDLKEFIGNLPIIAHNASFDWGFIKEKSKDLNLKFTNDVYDTLAMSKELLPHLKSHKLERLADYLMIESDGDFHRAINDVIVLNKIFIMLLAVIEKRGVDISKYKI